MRFLITQDKNTFEKLSNKLMLIQTIDADTDKPTWVFQNEMTFDIDLDDLNFCLSDTLFL